MNSTRPNKLSSKIALRSVIERYLLREALEAILLCMFEQENPGATMHQEQINVRSRIGSLRMKSPFTDSLSFLLSGPKLKLKPDVKYFLALPFCDAVNMRRFMSEILGEPPTDQLIHSFGYELSRRIQSLHTTPLASEWQSLLIGTLRVTAPSSCPHPLELDYCIGRAESGETVILGLWDPANKEPNRWRNICNQLKGRGLERSQSVITDEAVGSANAFITILNPDIGDDVFRDDATENSTPVPTILLEHALPEDAEIEEVMSHKEELIPVRPTAHMSAPSLVLPSIAFVLLVLFGGFYSSAKESIASSLSASTAESAHTGSLSPTGSQLVGPLERQILKELKDHASESENIAAIIRVAAHSQNGEILEELINLSDHQDSVVRASVAQAIAYGSEVSSPKRMRSLLRLLVDPDFLVRGMAAKSLGKIGTADAIEALQLRLKYEDNGVVRRVIEKLVREKGFVFSR